MENFYGITPTRMLPAELNSMSKNMCGMADTAKELMDSTIDLEVREGFRFQKYEYNCAEDSLKAMARATVRSQSTTQDTSEQSDQDTPSSPGFSWSSLDPLRSVAGQAAALGGLLAIPLTGWAQGLRQAAGT